MLFNSGVFLAFFAVVFILYWSLYRSFRLQNLLLLVASYIFYASWDWRLLSLLVFTTVVTYFLALEIEKAGLMGEAGKKRKDRLVFLSIATLLGLLGIFKYFNFFASSLQSLASAFGITMSPVTLQIILPVGISFYTFQAISYVIDVKRGDLKATHNFVEFAVFKSFFPQLVAGPIERASNLLPQFAYPRRLTPEQVQSGLYLFLWGMFKKVVIADRVAVYANQVFNNYGSYHGVDIWIGVFAFAIQIYCDFSGYSDMARGIAKLFGFELMINFRLPYFAVNPSDFWNRWHISLSSWLRDYLYVPLGGNRYGTLNTYRNLFLTMLLGGLWHGAAWNFIFWGAYHGIILILYRRFEQRPVHRAPWSGEFPIPIVLAKMGFMFLLTLIGWLLFRAETTDQIFTMLTSFTPLVSGETLSLLLNVLIPTLSLLAMQIIQYRTNDLMFVMRLPLWQQIALCTALLIAILLFAMRESSEFIYFQF